MNKKTLFLVVFILCILFGNLKSVAQSESKKARMWIDEPTINYIDGKSINVVGWLLSDDKNAILKIYIDGKDTNTIIARVEREDVLNAIPGYGGRESNPKPGFVATLDFSKVTYGSHTIKYAVIDSNGVEIQKIEKIVNIDNRTKARMYLDTPTGNYIDGKSVDVSGWFLCSDTSSILKIYIDEKYTNAVITRVERNDVLNAIPGYGGKTANPKPGFTTTLDLSKIAYGNHTIKYAVLDGNGIELQKIEKTVNIDNRTKARMWIDEPTENYIDGKSAEVSGWLLCSDASSTLKIYIDGKDTNAVITRVERNDVLNAIPGYGGRISNPKPGFTTTLDFSKISYGSHTIKYAVLDGNGTEIQKIEKIVNIDNRTKARMWIDSPHENEIETTDNEINIVGWYLCSDSNSNIEVLVDNKNVSDKEISRIERNDVLNAIPGYGGKVSNPLPGFNINIKLSNYNIGKHTLKVIIKDDINELTSKSYIINVRKARMWIDSPTRDLIDLKNWTVRGWMLSNQKEAELHVFINDKEIEAQSYNRLKRDDVLNAISGYGGKNCNSNPGFEYTMDLSGYEKGNYTLTYKVISKSGETLAEINKNITIDYTPRIKMYIDNPGLGGVENTNGIISGWLMTNIENTSMDVYIDGIKKYSNPQRIERNDVVNSIYGYGGIENNPQPGFIININYGEYSLGGHTLKIVVKDQNNKEVLVQSRYFNIYEPYKLEIGTYGLSCQGRALNYYKIGNGPNVYFATFAVHGFEDKWNNDGQELTNIAEAFKNRLVNDKDRNILSKWTIYILPQVNPDGVQAGWSNNGPGRQTLGSWGPDNKGIDINRSWQTEASYIRYYGRNYNGTAPFQSPEIAKLREFLLNKRATAGQTVLVDLHGWTTQLIGDQGICDFYAVQFPSNTRTYSYGRQYLVNWARMNLGANGRVARSALIELPSAGINSHQDVVNNNYAGRYIEATLNMLRAL